MQRIKTVQRIRAVQAPDPSPHPSLATTPARARRLRHAATSVLALCALTLASGCASYQPRQVPDVHNLPNSRQFDGFSMGAEVPENTVDLLSRFDRDLLKYNVVPVHIYLRSTASDADFSIDPETIGLRYDDGTELEQITPAEAYQRCRYSHWRAVPGWFVVIGFFCHPFIAGANGEMERDFNDKRLKRQKLIRDTPSARDGTVGVVYFAPRGDDDLEFSKIKNGGALSADIVKYESDSPDAPKTLRILFDH